MDLIKCPICGEMYSESYPRCPFCEEDSEQPRKISFIPKPKHRIADKKKAQSARGGLIVVLVLVLALLSWYLFGDNIVRDKTPEKPGDETVEPNVPANNPNTSDDPFYQPPDGTNGEQTPDDTQGQPAESDPNPGETTPEPVIDENVDVSNAQLNRSDFTLSGVGDSYRVKLSGTEATPLWSIDNANVATVASDGTVKAVANGNTTLRCKVGTRELTCIVRVNNTGKTAAPADAPTTAPVTPTTQTPTTQTPTTQTPSTQTPAAQTPSGTAHVDVSSLSVKTNYGTLLQKDPGTGYPDCTVRIGGDPISLKIVGTDVPVSSWTSDKTSVVTVDESGHLTPVSAGTAHVTATVGDATITCIIRVR